MTLIASPCFTPSFVARYFPSATPRSPSGVSNDARGPMIFASIGEVRPRVGSMPFIITSEPVVFVSVVTTPLWKSTGEPSATPGCRG